jgi:diaminopimelate epimerase
MLLQFWKVEGAGNDFILIDDRQDVYRDREPAVAQRLCYRRFGIGADGVIFIRSAADYDFEMFYFNADGSGPAMCGNGARAALLFVNASGICRQVRYHFKSSDGGHLAEFRDGQIRLTIQRPLQIQALAQEIPAAFLVDTGVPHLVIFTSKLASLDLNQLAPALRWKYNANVNYIEKQPKGYWAIRTFERGVEAETLACGTGSTASAIVIQEQRQEHLPLQLHARGGALTISEQEEKLWLSGPTRKVFEGQFEGQF